MLLTTAVGLAPASEWEEIDCPYQGFSQRKVAAMKANYTLGSAENNNKTH